MDKRILLGCLGGAGMPLTLAGTLAVAAAARRGDCAWNNSGVALDCAPARLADAAMATVMDATRMVLCICVSNPEKCRNDEGIESGRSRRIGSRRPRRTASATTRQRERN